jgi:GGDEF domain-containing protein
LNGQFFQRRNSFTDVRDDAHAFWLLSDARQASTASPNLNLERQEVAEKIRASLAAPYRLVLDEGSLAGCVVEHRCSASIGAVLFLNHEASQSDLLKWADSAMYRAKDAGRDVIRFHGLPQ